MLRGDAPNGPQENQLASRLLDGNNHSCAGFRPASPIAVQRRRIEVNRVFGLKLELIAPILIVSDPFITYRIPPQDADAVSPSRPTVPEIPLQRRSPCVPWPCSPGIQNSREHPLSESKASSVVGRLLLTASAAIGRNEKGPPGFE